MAGLAIFGVVYWYGNIWVTEYDFKVKIPKYAKIPKLKIPNKSSGTLSVEFCFVSYNIATEISKSLIKLTICHVKFGTTCPIFLLAPILKIKGR